MGNGKSVVLVEETLHYAHHQLHLSVEEVERLAIALSFVNGIKATSMQMGRDIEITFSARSTKGLDDLKTKATGIIRHAINRPKVSAEQQAVLDYLHS